MEVGLAGFLIEDDLIEDAAGDILTGFRVFDDKRCTRFDQFHNVVLDDVAAG